MSCLLTEPIAEAESRPKSAHRYNVAEQQIIYKSEIERIWKAQYDSLSRKDEPQLTDEEVREDANAKKLLTRTPGPLSPTLSRGSSLAPQREGTPPSDQRKILRIKRKVGETGLLSCVLVPVVCSRSDQGEQVDGEWRTEIIRDTAVINAYVKKRQAIEEENTTADALAPTGDAEKDKRMKKR